jgi:hypothetical protein
MYMKMFNNLGHCMGLLLGRILAKFHLRSSVETLKEFFGSSVLFEN